ncbi:hypothetical protein Tsubulata_005022 [Turnera subulata]|uniref:MADS-box domain-containing protein n=1 Tax=Turnera subulata TaxID=218843 RepID=A0A9Q0FB99_9ROSI|nr:hypothetical protein Tsubulata_005022 [Turnera subulata]
MANKKPSIGRQKIKIEKIPKKNHLQVTFSKRRAGLFKKASELCTLCGVEIAITVFSPANKAFSFGHPDVDSVMERFLNQNPPLNSAANRFFEAHRNANIHDLNVQLTQVLSQLEGEKMHGEALDQVRKASQSQCWWESPVEELGLQELKQVRDALEELKKEVMIQRNKILVDYSANSLPFFTVNGIGPVGNFEAKPETSSPSTITNVNNFGCGHGNGML